MSENYRVLARKYRPETFADLVGQDSMVRVLKNAFEAGRIAQAFIMTGIRGTGKTTTARIIAKGLNCEKGPTVEPCGVCDNCKAISEGRHVDVVEMDAASHTGVDDIRDIISTVHYRAVSARYKVYIIDEVHMLSTNAFNALLKTLEEPPEHVKFIFATTEIRKVPVTVLSRCQRFDLRRIEPEVMIALMRRIATSEGAAISDDALALITRAAEGSARDATSLLDQAISHGASETTAEQVRSMLGLADRARVMDLFTKIMQGDAAGALEELSAQYADGADPVAVLRDLAELTHWLSVVKITPATAEDATVTPDERKRGLELASGLPQRVLARAWQMLLKALEETGAAPNAMMAAEMAVIRLTHVADLPTPDELIRQIESTPRPDGPSGGQRVQNTTSAAPMARQSVSANGGTVTALAAQPEEALARFDSFEMVIRLIRANRDQVMLIDVEKYVRLARYQPGRIEFTPADGAPSDLSSRLAQRLQTWTGVRWGVTLVNDCTTPTFAETRNADEALVADKAKNHPLVQSIFKAFPGAKITDIRKPRLAEIDALPVAPESDETGDDWDPFEDG
ncbi:MAG: DNA polymerase III subunit gamma/tau [Deltaproteobacteria bacterium]